MRSNYPPNSFEPSELNDPISFKYDMRAPWGFMSQVITVDVNIELRPETSIPRIGHLLWIGAIATAITRSVHLDLLWWVRWKGPPLATPAAPADNFNGLIWDDPAPKNACVLVQQDTGDNDNMSKRLITLPGTPRGWSTGGILTQRGWDNAMVWAHALRMGLSGIPNGCEFTHLIAYPDVVTPSLENLGGVRFRRVEYLRVLQYTDKAPDNVNELWP